MARDHETVLEFDYDEPPVARIVARSVRQEVGDIEGDRTTVSLNREGSLVTVSVSASDLVALRAGINTWSSLVSVAESCAGSD